MVRQGAGSVSVLDMCEQIFEASNYNLQAILIALKKLKEQTKFNSVGANGCITLGSLTSLLNFGRGVGMSRSRLVEPRICADALCSTLLRPAGGRQ